MVCNAFSTVIGMSGLAWASNGAITELSVMSVPIVGTISLAQLNAWGTFPTYFDDLV